jgi:hypothetical protein
MGRAEIAGRTQGPAADGAPGSAPFLMGDLGIPYSTIRSDAPALLLSSGRFERCRLPEKRGAAIPSLGAPALLPVPFFGAVVLWWETAPGCCPLASWAGARW